ncbi:MAG: hypothetical protein PHT94_03650 [Candidatus Nanoarchaeia archaeon]|nr:hypothetical protein [Candidatus Nanoarchaeia archaeon]
MFRILKNINKKADVWVSSILYFSLAFIVIILVLNYLSPTLDKIKLNSELKVVESEAKKIDTILKELVKEGKGSQKIINLDLKGTNIIASNDSLKIMLGDSFDIKERKISENVVISNRDELIILENETHYVLSNSFIQIIINKIGEKDNFEPINTSNIISNIKNLENNININSNFTFFVGDILETSTGYGYTELLKNPLYDSYARVNIYVYNEIVNYMFSVVIESESRNINFLGPYFI